MRCRRFRLDMSAYIDSEMTCEERAEFESHAFSCPECNEHYNEFRDAVFLIRGVLREHGHEMPTAEIDAIMRRSRARATALGVAVRVAACAAVTAALYALARLIHSLA